MNRPEPNYLLFLEGTKINVPLLKYEKDRNRWHSDLVVVAGIHDVWKYPR